MLGKMSKVAKHLHPHHKMTIFKLNSHLLLVSTLSPEVMAEWRIRAATGRVEARWMEGPDPMDWP